MKLHEFLTLNRDELIARCTSRVAKRSSPMPTARELQHGIPIFMTQLTEMLRQEGLNPSEARSSGRTPEAIASRIGKTASEHGFELLQQGFTVDQVVHDYGDLCQAVTELAIETDAPIKSTEFSTLNRCLDDAIAYAVSEFGRVRDQVIADANEQILNERLGVLVHEFRNLVNTATLATNALKGGTVGIGGSTGAILDRSLKGLNELCKRVLADVRLTAGIPLPRDRVIVSQFIDEVRVSAAIDADAQGIQLVVPNGSDAEPGVEMEIDAQVVAGALANLLQNAFKFTRRQGCVFMRIIYSGDRVLIEVEDECGGLPEGNGEDLFRSFEQRSVDRSGLGLGLGISRRGVEANGGSLTVRNLPGHGCVFTIDLPKAHSI